ncbi:MAG: hypothetical protein JWM53_6516 [bacterium]|nr:hypothetical protein [bacterium]
MFTAEIRVGRLLEVRMRSPLPLHEAQALVAEIRRLVKGTRAPSLGVIDLRGVRLLDPDVVDFLGELMRRDNPWLARNAFVLAEAGAIKTLQVERMLKEGGSASRRGFRQRKEAEAWLGEALDEPERARLRAFLDEAP